MVSGVIGGQTVPRAELRAILSILTRVPEGAEFTVRVDAGYLLGFSQDPEGMANMFRKNAMFCNDQILEKNTKAS